MIRVFYEVISDLKVREAIKSLLDSLNQTVWMKGNWHFKEVEISGAVTGHQITHSLGFRPKDVLLLHNSENVTVTWEYGDFTKSAIFVTTSGATQLRFFVGQYQEA